MSLNFTVLYCEGVCFKHNVQDRTSGSRNIGGSREKTNLPLTPCLFKVGAQNPGVRLFCLPLENIFLRFKLRLFPLSQFGSKSHAAISS